MQQTEHLKLNLIETGDPMSPAPLNANAQALDALVAGIAAEQHLFKLGEVSVPKESKEKCPISIDLSGVDLNQYRAIILWGEMAYEDNYETLTANGANFVQVLECVHNGSDGNANCFVMILLARAWNDIYVFSRFYGVNDHRDNVTNGGYSGRYPIKWEDLHTLKFSNKYRAGSFLRIIGIKF